MRDIRTFLAVCSLTPSDVLRAPPNVASRIISPLVGPHRPATLSIVFFSPPRCVMKVWGQSCVSSLTKETLCAMSVVSTAMP